ncbi:MAG: Gfo/Idh/MocA family oxidoreductase [Thermomicrobiales bacterium]|nr:Gfo/Idh/MocA family oxidoreductase [Thermomicrobiales bacterium]
MSENTPLVSHDGPIRWGIVGTGNIAKIFARDLPLARSAELVAVGSRSQEKADAFGDMFNIPRRYDSYEGIVNDPDIDVVYVATPHPWHHDITIQLLNAGKNVLCEKPMAMNVAETREMIEAARANGCFLMEAIWTRFRPAMVKVREFLNDGTIGEVQYLTATMGWNNPFDADFRLFNKDLGGSALLDAGIYAVQMVQMVLGKPVEMVSVATLGESGVDENCMITTRHANGGVANAGITVRASSRNLCMIAGSNGTIVMDHDWHRPSTFTLFRAGQEPEFFDCSHEGIGYQFEMNEVEDCLRGGIIEHPVISWSDSLEIAQIMQDALRSWGVTFPYDRD